MKKILLMVLVLIGSKTFAQVESHVKWAYASKKIGDKDAVLFLKATIDEGWHIYALNVKEGGPISTSFTFEPAKGYALSGKVTAPKPTVYFDKNFGLQVGYYEKGVIFQQRIKFRPVAATAIKGKLEFMTCNDKKCLPPEDVNFTIPLSK